MKKIVRLKESDLQRIVKRVLKEQVDGLPNDDMEVLARGGANQSQNQVAIFFIMDAVSDAEAAAITTIIETYMDAIGTGVIP